MSEQRIAPDGAIWVCAACGKTSKDLHEFGDEACVLNAVLCKEKLSVDDSPWQKWEAAK